ncbi:MAG: NRDE family protein [Nitrospirota bacterium]
MCLLLCAHKSHPGYPLIIAANRDEFHARPASEAQYWNDEPSILAGKDLQAGGTWLGITKYGRIAAVTNYHEHTLNPLPPQSRGALVSDFLRSEAPPQEYAEHLIRNGRDYQGFTLVFGTVETLFYYSNRSNEYGQIKPGIHGLSNHLFNDNSWKVSKGGAFLKDLLSRPDSISPEDLFTLLSDRTRAPRNALSGHGYETEKEGLYSSIFISGKEFGTRCSTAIIIDNGGNVRFSERTFSPEGLVGKTVEYEFSLLK